MDPNEFVDFSGKIVGHGPAGARSAVSRAYYGAYHLALSILEDVGCSPPGRRNSHDLVPQFLIASSQGDAIDAGHLLSDLHSERIKADYRLDNPDVETEKFAKLGVETAHNVRSHLQAFRVACDEPSILQKLQEGVGRLIRARQGPPARP